MLDHVPPLPSLLGQFLGYAPFCLLIALTMSSGGCARQEGAVELDWSIVDGNFDDLFPGQRYSSSCRIEKLAKYRLPSTEPGQEVDVNLKVQVRLRVFDCPDEQSGEQCQQSKPIGDRVFDCDHMRGTIGNLSSSDHSYLFVVDTFVTPHLDNAGAIIPKQSCVATPGVRRRRIRAGQITNLAVYQVVIGATPERPLLLNDCNRALPDSTGGSSDTGPQSTTPTSQDTTSAPQDTAPPPR